jgi:type II secretory ATPase GspE/PulE/Tfp pilus assembly ATPase PilB-like protein
LGKSPFDKPRERSVASRALRDSGLLQFEDLDRAEKLAEERHIGVDRATVLLGLLSEDQVTFLVANRQGLDLVFPTPDGVDLEFLARFPAELLRRHKAVPLVVQDEHAVVAFGDVPTAEVLAELARHAGLPVRPVLAAARRLEHTLERVLGRSRPHRVTTVGEHLSEGTTFERHVASAFDAGAEELRFEPSASGVRLRVRRHGALVDEACDAAASASTIANAARLLVKLPPSTTAQTADTVVAVGGRDLELRLAIVPTTAGELVVVARRDAAEVDLASCGLPPETADWLVDRFCASAAAAAPALVLATATDRALLHAFASAVLDRVDPANAVALLTREPRHDGEGRTRVVPADLDGATGARALRCARPDVLFVDAEDAPGALGEAVAAAQSGARVLVGLVDPDPRTAVDDLLDSVVLGARLRRTVSAVVLLDRCPALCASCSEEDPEPQGWTGARLPGGCGACEGRGFAGFEVVAAGVRSGVDLRSGVVGAVSDGPQVHTARVAAQLRDLVAAGRITKSDAAQRLALLERR